MAPQDLAAGRHWVIDVFGGELLYIFAFYLRGSGVGSPI